MKYIQLMAYGSVIGNFLYKSFRKLSFQIAGKRGTLCGDNQIVGMFAVYSDTTAIVQARHRYILIGNAEYEKIIYSSRTAIYDLLRECDYMKNMHTHRWKFERIEVLSPANYPEHYGSITSTGLSGIFMDQETHFAVISAFKEFAA